MPDWAYTDEWTVINEQDLRACSIQWDEHHRGLRVVGSFRLEGPSCNTPVETARWILNSDALDMILPPYLDEEHEIGEVIDIEAEEIAGMIRVGALVDIQYRSAYESLDCDVLFRQRPMFRGH